MKKFSLSTLGDAAQWILDGLQGRNVVALHGPMGAGKTTLIAEIVRRLGSHDTVTSPTFAIVNEYRDGEDRPIFHFDCYRIESVREAADIGVEEYFDSGNLCLVEWPERILPLLPDDTMRVEIKILDHQTRQLTIR